jgi:hypothetical protein
MNLLLIFLLSSAAPLIVFVPAYCAAVRQGDPVMCVIFDWINFTANTTVA